MGLISDGYRFIPTAKEQRANGEMTIADQKVANGIYHHTIAGVLCSQLLPQALIGGANLLFNGSKDSDSGDAKPEAKSKNDVYKDFENLVGKYKTEKDQEKRNNLYTDLQKMQRENPHNDKLQDLWTNKVKNNSKNNNTQTIGLQNRSQV